MSSADERAPAVKVAAPAGSGGGPPATTTSFHAAQAEHVWDSMPRETQELWGCLGWNCSNWDSGGAEVWSESVFWADLPPQCQSAAQSLGFSQPKWDNEESTQMTSKRDFVHLAFECLVKLNLEVFGAAGAVWGFSEVVGLRTADNKNAWQVTAIVVGFIFFLRCGLFAPRCLHRAALPAPLQLAFAVRADCYGLPQT